VAKLCRKWSLRVCAMISLHTIGGCLHQCARRIEKRQEARCAHHDASLYVCRDRTDASDFAFGVAAVIGRLGTAQGGMSRVLGRMRVVGSSGAAKLCQSR
jgi:hypothetical protein